MELPYSMQYFLEEKQNVGIELIALERYEGFHSIVFYLIKFEIFHSEQW